MIANPPKRRDANGKRIPGVARGTLIVAPLALIEQWDAEIAAKVEDQVKLKVYLHHGPSRTKGACYEITLEYQLEMHQY